MVNQFNQGDSVTHKTLPTGNMTVMNPKTADGKVTCRRSIEKSYVDEDFYPFELKKIDGNGKSNLPILY